jgi:hypothetical protein
MNDLTTTNVWLAILAIISMIEFLMIAAAGVFAYRAYMQVMTTIQTVERVHIAPLRARVDTLLDEVESITDKLKVAQDSVGQVFAAASGAGSLIADTVRFKSWPVVGILRGIRIAASILKQPMRVG